MLRRCIYNDPSTQNQLNVAKTRSKKDQESKVADRIKANDLFFSRYKWNIVSSLGYYYSFGSNLVDGESEELIMRQITHTTTMIPST